jgi:threonine dehydratase
MIRRLAAEEVVAARQAIEPYLPPTPLRRSLAASGEVFTKLECWQPTGSFKVRGATHFMTALSEADRKGGVVAASAGNPALGVAFAADAVGNCEATLFVPTTAPRAKVEKLRQYKVTVHEKGATYDDAHHAALDYIEENGGLYLHAYDDPRTAAGQGTVGLEILEQCPDVEVIVVPVGGGGLISGIATIVKKIRPDVKIFAVQPEASPALRESLKRGEPLLTYPAGETLADGLSGGIGEVVFVHRDLLDGVVTVSEEETISAIYELLAKDQVVAEASGAVSLAALRSGRIPHRGPAVAVITGANIDAQVLARIVRSRS